MKKRYVSILTALMGMLAAGGAQGAVPTKLTYTGRLLENGQPKTGEVSVTFRLFDKETGGSQLWTETFSTMQVTEGIFVADLGEKIAFSSTIFNGSTRYLEITVGSQTLTPRVAIQSVPYAIRAGIADSVGTLTEANIQKRITGTCAAGTAIRVINANGTVTCQTAGSSSGGDITAVTTGYGLLGGKTSGDVSLSVDTSKIQSRVTGTCAAGSSISKINSDGTVTCETDNVGAGDITGVTAGNGLKGGGTTGTVSLSIDTTIVPMKTGTTNQNFDSNTLFLDYANNRVGIRTSSPAYQLDIVGDIRGYTYRYRNRKYYYQYYSANDFQSSYSNFPLYSSSYSKPFRYTNNANSANASTTLHLPQGADITEVRCYYYDTHATYNITSFYFYLYSRTLTHTGSGATLASAGGNPGAHDDTTSIPSIYDNTVSGTGDNGINNATYEYTLRVYFYTGGNNCSTSCRFYGCRVAYTLGYVSSP